MVRLGVGHRRGLGRTARLKTKPLPRVALTAMLLAPAVVAGAGRDLLDLLVGEYNNHEQVWQQKLDGAAVHERRHWRFERTGETRVSLSLARGQFAGTPDWEFDLQVGGLDTAVSPAGVGGLVCLYRWQADMDGIIGRATGAGCPETLPKFWRVTPTHLFSHHGPPESEIRYAARRVRYYSGWVSLQRRHIDPNASEDDFILIRGLRLHDEGSVFSITDAGKPTGYAVELARLTYQNTRTSVLKLGILEEAEGNTLGYSWAAPGAERLGINLRWLQAGFTREE